MRRGLYRLNSTVLGCRLNAPNCISSRRSTGKLFHTQGPATEKTPVTESVVHYKTRLTYIQSNIDCHVLFSHTVRLFLFSFLNQRMEGRVAIIFWIFSAGGEWVSSG